MRYAKIGNRCGCRTYEKFYQMVIATANRKSAHLHESAGARNGSSPRVLLAVRGGMALGPGAGQMHRGQEVFTSDTFFFAVLAGRRALGFGVGLGRGFGFRHRFGDPFADFGQ